MGDMTGTAPWSNTKAESTTLDYYEASRRRDIAAGVLQALVAAQPKYVELQELPAWAVKLTDDLLATLSK